jgi:streptogramin lyase
VHTSNLHRTPGSANIAVGDGYVWIAQGTEEGGGMWFVSRLDPSTYDFRALTFDTGFSTTQPEVAVGPGALWVTRGGTHSASALERLSPDPFNAVTAFDLPDGAPVGLDAVTVGEGYVWATSARGYLWKVDPITNKFLGDPTLVGDAPPIGAPDVVAAFGFVWVASDDGQIWQYAA